MASSSSLSPSASPPPPPPAPSQSHSSSPSPSPKHESRIPPAPESKSTSSARKPSPLPWTHQETLALIQAYQEKWYSLKKGQLKAFQWEEVSVTVAARCGFDEPSKTATQCRHKIEKLRKRYRSELQKPYPNSWQYFELLDQMERGPTLLYARPITAVAKSFSNNANSNSNSNNISNFNHDYGSFYSNPADYYNNDSHGGGGSDDSDENLNAGVKAAARNKSKSINNIVDGGVKGRVTGAKGIAMEKGFNGSGSRSVRVLRNQMNGVRKQYYDGDDSDDDDDDDNEEENDDDEDDVEEEEEQVQIEDGAGRELAAEIRGFTERFIGMESRRMEMMRETERYRMEMEKKRMEMILEAQRKIFDSIGRAFVGRKKAKIDQET
ncbi:hypothetical protein ACS0TY_006415 [Phlomoides rotata]